MRGELHSLQWRASGLTVQHSQLKGDEAEENLFRTRVMNPLSHSLPAVCLNSVRIHWLSNYSYLFSLCFVVLICFAKERNSDCLFCRPESFLFVPTMSKFVHEPLRAEVTFPSSTCDYSSAAID